MQGILEVVVQKAMLAVTLPYVALNDYNSQGAVHLLNKKKEREPRWSCFCSSLANPAFVEVAVSRLSVLGEGATRSAASLPQFLFVFHHSLVLSAWVLVQNFAAQMEVF